MPVGCYCTSASGGCEWCCVSDETGLSAAGAGAGAGDVEDASEAVSGLLALSAGSSFVERVAAAARRTTGACRCVFSHYDAIEGREEAFLCPYLASWKLPTDVIGQCEPDEGSSAGLLLVLPYASSDRAMVLDLMSGSHTRSTMHPTTWSAERLALRTERSSAGGCFASTCAFSALEHDGRIDVRCVLLVIRELVWGLSDLLGAREAPDAQEASGEPGDAHARISERDACEAVGLLRSRVALLLEYTQSGRQAP